MNNKTKEIPHYNEDMSFKDFKILTRFTILKTNEILKELAQRIIELEKESNQASKETMNGFEKQVIELANKEANNE